MSFGVIVYACQVNYLARGHTEDNGDGTHVVGRLLASLSSALSRWLLLLRFVLSCGLRVRNAHATKKRPRNDAAAEANDAFCRVPFSLWLYFGFIA